MGHPPPTPHSVNNPSGSLGPGKSQAVCTSWAAAQRLWSDCVVPEQANIKALDPEGPEAKKQPTALIDRGD